MNKRQRKILDSQDPQRAFWYAYNHNRKGRWPEAEQFIIKDACWACTYAANIIKGRWPEAEETISKVKCYAHIYVWRVIEGQRSAVIETNYLCDTSQCEYYVVKDYLSKIDWADPANDFPIPKRLKRALKKLSILA